MRKDGDILVLEFGKHSKHKGRTLHDVPRSYLRWLAEQEWFADEYPNLAGEVRRPAAHRSRLRPKTTIWWTRTSPAIRDFIERDELSNSIGIQSTHGPIVSAGFSQPANDAWPTETAPFHSLE
jgi:hypothetical protein